MQVPIPCKVHKHGVARRPFQPGEDALLIQILQTQVFLNWDVVAQQFNGRTARQCRERWMNYLSPSVRTGQWTREEDERLLALVNEHGRSWSVLSRLFNGRSENDIKNRWYSHVQHEVVRDCGRLALARTCPFARFTERKKRRHAVVDVKENALRLLEESARVPSADSSPLCDSARSEMSPAVDELRVFLGGEFGCGSGFEWLD
jgi:hypothetical protein